MNTQPVAVVVGTVFVDLKCFPQQELNFKGRNLGKVSFFHGGVGRNVAENMARLGTDVRFCSSVQEDGIGAEVLARLQGVGIDTTGVGRTSEPRGHGMWVAILQPDGDLACSLSQMPDVSYMQQAFERQGAELLKNAGLVVLEVDLSVDLAEQVLDAADAAGVPVVGLPGNFACIRAKPTLLAKLQTFVCNQHEAEELYGRPVSSIPAAMHAVKALWERGLQQVVITLGPLGSVAGEQGSTPFHVPALPIEVQDTTGAGDSFVAGLSHCLAAGADLRLAVEAASRVAAWTVSVQESVCQNLAQRVSQDHWEGWRRLTTGNAVR